MFCIYKNNIRATVDTYRNPIQLSTQSAHPNLKKLIGENKANRSIV